MSFLQNFYINMFLKYGQPKNFRLNYDCQQFVKFLLHINHLLLLQHFHEGVFFK